MVNTKPPSHVFMPVTGNIILLNREITRPFEQTVKQGAKSRQNPTRFGILLCPHKCIILHQDMPNTKNNNNPPYKLLRIY